MINRYMERPPFKATESQFKFGFELIGPILRPLQQSILKHQLAMPDYACFASDLAELCGKGHHGPINSAYANIAKHFCKAADFAPPRREGDGKVQWWSILSTAEAWDHGKWKWHMHPELASALLSLGWRSAIQNAPASHDHRCNPPK